jgi:hypothetical protein
LIDGEAIVCDENGLAVFELTRRNGALASAVHCASTYWSSTARIYGDSQSRNARGCWQSCCAARSIVLNQTFGEDGAIVFREACKLGCEGIVSKRLGSPYRSGRSAHWVKVKNPKAPAVRREAEEDWGR